MYLPRSGCGVAYRVSRQAGWRDGSKIWRVTPADDSRELFSMGVRI